ncbi:hypothetical protein [Sedimentitalea nanhaiensis]|uniref:Uncharacterized protein n=1 Tax=Sedimentitalea nanhaiensis TaxID=999627 RepID=A0A1I7DY15_9RHOB|nr:hypothetical protein [Sedimentitalea nanhaiensis]SFU16569.1 hypothetical protein SAMN05216236_13728 [Sedimentitalea nanhaiensis]
MTDILELFQSYSPALIFAAALIAAAVFVLKKTTEKAINLEFDRHAKALTLGLERRSRFEEMVLIERYETLNDLLSRLDRIASDVRRYRHGTDVEGLMRGTEIVPLTEVFERLSTRRHVLTERFYPKLDALGGLLIQYLNARDTIEAQRVQGEYKRLLNTILDEMSAVFGLNRISADTHVPQAAS